MVACIFFVFYSFSGSLIPTDHKDVVGRMIMCSTTAHDRTYFSVFGKKDELFVFNHETRTFNQIMDGRLQGIGLKFIPTTDGVALIDPDSFTCYLLTAEGEFKEKKRWNFFDSDIYSIWLADYRTNQILCSFRSLDPLDKEIHLAILDISTGQRKDIGYLPPEDLHGYVVSDGAQFFRIFSHTGAIQSLGTDFSKKGIIRGHREKVTLRGYKPTGGPGDTYLAHIERIGNPLLVGKELYLFLSVIEDGQFDSYWPIMVKNGTATKAKEPLFMFGKAKGSELWFDLEEGAVGVR